MTRPADLQPVVDALLLASRCARGLADDTTDGTEVAALKWHGLVSYLRESGMLPLTDDDLAELDTATALKETDA